jgi:hypothetical protein
MIARVAMMVTVQTANKCALGSFAEHVITKLNDDALNTSANDDAPRPNTYIKMT